ncbi:MAG: hypothetical protein HKL96_06455 [Phycisphaerales bacterium]|nr:hypothetical protein [Phycisphaerales bacterium]
MKKANLPMDSDLRGALLALRRAARDALRLAIQTGTPCYVMRHGKIVNLAAKGSKRKSSALRGVKVKAKRRGRQRQG